MKICYIIMKMLDDFIDAPRSNPAAIFDAFYLSNSLTLFLPNSLSFPFFLPYVYAYIYMYICIHRKQMLPL